MKQRVLFIFPLLLFFTVFSISAKVHVVTSIPDIADIVEEIGGDQVTVFSLAKGHEDIHYIRAKSSFLPIIKRAHLVMSLGLEAEKAWLPGIVKSSRNKRVYPGKKGWVEVYEGLKILEKPSEKYMADHAHAGGHRFGNPHFNNGPDCGKIVAENVCRALTWADRKNAPFYYKNYLAYQEKLKQMEQKLHTLGEALRGVHVVTFHADLSYLIKFYNMKLTGCIEPKPGLPPTPKHTARLIKKCKKNHTKLILYHQAQNPGLPKRIAKETGAQLVCFANMVKSRPEVQSYIALQEYNLQLMLDALKAVQQ